MAPQTKTASRTKSSIQIDCEIKTAPVVKSETTKASKVGQTSKDEQAKPTHLVATEIRMIPLEPAGAQPQKRA